VAKTLDPPARPPTFDALLEVFRRTTPREYYQPIADKGDGTPTDSFALFRGLARQFTKLAAKGTRSIQARYLLPSALQTDIPATSANPASGSVTLRRTGPSADALIVDAGRMRIQGPGSRFYVNAAQIVWNPGDTANRTVTFVSEVAGFVGNLDHLAAADGTIDLDLVSIADQDFDRAAPSGSILLTGPQATGQDSGIPDLFAPEDIGLYLRINNATNASNIGRSLRIVGFEWPELEIPAGSGRYPRRVFLETEERRNTVEVLQDDGGAFTDFYSQATDETATNDVPLLPAAPAVADAFYFGFTAPFAGVEIRFDTPGAGDWTIVWEYWDGAAWQSLPDLDDRTEGLRPASSSFSEVRWSIPADWATLASPSGSGLTLYFARARVSAFTSITTQPLAGRIVHFVPESLTAETGTITWSLLDFDSLGLQLSSVQAPAGGRDDDLYVLGDSLGLYQQAAESDDVFRDRASRLADVVSPNAIVRVLNRALRPLGYEGRAFDVTIDTTPDGSLVGAGFTGLFCDLETTLAPDILGAFDLYAPGDAFPADPWLVLQSADEAYGWFIVALPYLGNGDFGVFFDEGPLYFDETVQVYYGPSLAGFMDGAPTEGNATYASIYSSIDAIKPGGVGFTMVRRENLTTPGVC
jgi:hypothetical protein